MLVVGELKASDVCVNASLCIVLIDRRWSRYHALFVVVAISKLNYCACLIFEVR